MEAEKKIYSLSQMISVKKSLDNLHLNHIEYDTKEVWYVHKYNIHAIRNGSSALKMVAGWISYEEGGAGHSHYTTVMSTSSR